MDASALLAIFFEEPDAFVFESKLEAATEAWISPVNWWEVEVRLRSQLGPATARKALRWMEMGGLTVEPITLEQARIAASAHSTYRGRPARLNMGDCFAYALAKVKAAPLLYKGTDFRVTDIDAA